jgi:Flp pilus assembly protein TadG
MTRWRHSRGSSTERGASAVEFALILPVLTALIFALLGFGFVFAQQLGLNNAARDAARAGVVKPLGGTALTCANILTQARSTVGGTIGMSATAVGVSVTGPAGSCAVAANQSVPVATTTPCVGATAGSQLSVTLTYQSQLPVAVAGFSSLGLSSIGRFQCEYAS